MAVMIISVTMNHEFGKYVLFDSVYKSQCPLGCPIIHICFSWFFCNCNCSQMSKKLAGLAHNLRNTSLPGPCTLYGTLKCTPYFPRYCILYPVLYTVLYTRVKLIVKAGSFSEKHSQTCLLYNILNKIPYPLLYILMCIELYTVLYTFLCLNQLYTVLNTVL